MSTDLLAYVGQPLPVAHLLAAEEAVALTGLACTVLDLSNGETLASPPVGSETNTSVSAQAHEYRLFFTWTPAALPEGDGEASYLLTGEADTVPFPAFSGTILVWPAWSEFDRFIRVVKTLIQDHDLGQDSQTLGQRAYRTAVRLAVAAYSQDRPRKVQTDLTLTAGQWEYDLSDLEDGQEPAAAWREGISQVLGIEPRVDATVQSRYTLNPLGWSVDERRAKLRLEWTSPSAGDVARIDWQTEHLLTHTVNTLPANETVFGGLCRVAAGLLLAGPEAALYIRTSSPDIAAQFVNREPRSASARQLGMDWIREGRAMWNGTQREWSL